MREDHRIIMETAVSRMQARQAIPFSGEGYDTGFTRGIHTFGEKMASVIAIQLRRTLAPYLADRNQTSALGEHLRPALRMIEGRGNTYVIDVLTKLNDDGEPRFMMEASRRPGDGSPKAPVETFDLAVFQSYGSNTGPHGYKKTILTSSLDIYDDALFDISEIFVDDLRSLAEFCAATGKALPEPPPRLADLEKPVLRIDPAYAALVDIDGGLPGAAVAAAVDRYFIDAAGHVCDWAAGVLASVAASQTDRGFVWGTKYLNYNDLDDSCCAIDTGVEGRSASVHENTSLINPYQSFIAWVDKDAADIPRNLSVHMVHPDDRIGAAVDRLLEDDLAPTLSMDFETRHIVFADDFLDTNLLSMFSFYLRVDQRMFVENEMDTGRRNDLNVHEDFTDFRHDSCESLSAHL